MNKQTQDILIIAAVSITATLFFGWMASAVNGPGGSGDPTWFSFTCGTISLGTITLGSIMIGRRLAGMDP